jgi:subtilisin family serine protease
MMICLLKILLSVAAAHAAPKNWGLNAIHSPQAQSLSGHDKVIVAIIDTGIDPQIEELRAHLWRNPHEIANGKDEDGNGLVDDVHGYNFAARDGNIFDRHGHGSHVAGIIHAVAPNADLMILKYYEPGANLSNLNATVKAIEYAVQMGAQVINYSGGGTFANPAEKAALEKAAQKNILVVAAAGNDGADNDRAGFFPASYGLPNILSVGSLNPLLSLLASSNFGRRSVDIAAPGLDIFSTLPGGKLSPMTGTSQATAFVTGVAALLLSQNKHLSYVAVKERLLNFSHKETDLDEKIKSSAALDAYPVLASRGAEANAFDFVSEGETVNDPRYMFPAPEGERQTP